MYIYQQQKVDVAILEVGLGGRLDAANLWDTSLAIITSIGVDHIDWLGDDRDIIAVEKSGIMRADVPAFVANLIRQKRFNQKLFVLERHCNRSMSIFHLKFWK